ncbi:MAG TPA: acyl carrier protein [Lachnospiraceae bacterium]|jgi:acyl carrier protein|nr:acyl carrier protein [Lachnospiraceae bacterium]
MGSDREQLIEILNSVRPDVDFEAEDALIDDEILSSFDIIAMVSEINVQFGIEILVDDLLPENFNSVDAILQLIERMENE